MSDGRYIMIPLVDGDAAWRAAQYARAEAEFWKQRATNADAKPLEVAVAKDALEEWENIAAAAEAEVAAAAEWLARRRKLRLCGWRDGKRRWRAKVAVDGDGAWQAADEEAKAKARAWAAEQEKVFREAAAEAARAALKDKTQQESKDNG